MMRGMSITRREFARLAIAAIPAVSFLPEIGLSASSSPQEPDSRIAGVQIGLNVPYSFGNNSMAADEVLQRCVQLGVSAVELRSQPVEGFLGVPADLLARSSGRASTPDAEAAKKAALEQLRKWRTGVSMDKVKGFRKKYEDAGVRIEILKFDAIYARADDEVDYCFALAKALGARAISCEISVPDTKRLGQFADKHGLMVGYHGHTETGPQDWETAFGYAAHNGANLDIGHFVAGNHGSPIPFLTEHHDRITHIHVKDRKANNGPNVPFGQGDTPVTEVLRLLRDRRWPIQATIEFEYPIPPGSDRMTEIAKCVKYCEDALR
jgi:sugar phosphate isomerase/epimerase